jgi:hypothetical protein
VEPLSPHDPRAVGEFQLRARLGSGGMGRVYLGYSPAGRAVAVKVVHPELASDPEFARRFAHEVAAARAVGGMYTAPVVAAGLDDDPPWLATAFVPGPSLAEVVDKHGPLGEDAVWRLAAGLTEALRAVHACGLVHRDLKPANVLLAADGPHLIDFGISRALDGTSLTATGMVVGTPGYMSPEQAEGSPAGPPSDVFSLGVLLAYAASGSAPFGGGSAAAVLYRIVSGQPDLASVPPRIRELIAGCLTKDPAQRPDLATLATTISRASSDSFGAGIPGMSPTSFWPAPVAEIIRSSQVNVALGSSAPAGYRPAMAASGAPGTRSPWGTPSAGGYAQHRAAPAGAYRQPGASPAAAWPAPDPSADAMAAYRAGQRPPAATGPSTQVAAKLMHAGAVLTFLNMIVGLGDIGAVKASVIAQHPMMSPTTVRAVAGAASAGVIVVDVIGVVLWLSLASANRRGRSWPRPVGTVLFGIYTVAKISTIGGPGFAAGKILDAVIWLIGLLTVIALWRGPAGRPRYR